MKAYQAILNVHASGIAFGYEDGSYRPTVSVTRGQFAAFLARALEPSFRGTPTFTVESVSGWKKEPRSQMPTLIRNGKSHLTIGSMKEPFIKIFILFERVISKNTL